MSIDPHNSPGSGNLDYLLEDEEEPKRSGAGKFILILVALALAVGFGYLRWRNQGFAWLHLPASKPGATAPESTTGDSGAPGSAASSTPPLSSGPTSTSPSSATPAITPDSQAAATTPATNSGGGTTNPAGVPAGSTPATPVTANDVSKPPDGANAAGDSGKKSGAAPADAAPDGGTSASPDATDETPAPPPAKAKIETKPRAAVPAPDPVSEARKYLYGRGAAQDCDRGLRLLKPAANQGNPKAMVEMGALYSAGLCTPHDLPTAYRWFAMALHKEPDNESVQTDLQKLWGEMTQPERQLAIKMSQ